MGRDSASRNWRSSGVAGAQNGAADCPAVPVVSSLALGVDCAVIGDIGLLVSPDYWADIDAATVNPARACARHCGVYHQLPEFVPRDLFWSEGTVLCLPMRE